MTSVQIIGKAYREISPEAIETYKAENVIGDTKATCEAFNEYASDYLSHEDEGCREALDKKVVSITGYTLESIARDLLLKTLIGETRKEVA